MILNIQTSQAGLVGVLPTPIYINTSDTYAEVTATGYLNDAKQNGQAFSNEQMALVYTSDEGPVWLKVVVSGSDYSLVQISSPGDVVLPTTADTLIASLDTAGTLGNTTDPVTNYGTLITYKDNATSFRLKGPSSPNDPSAGADVQTYSGIFYNDSYSNFGVLKTRASYGANAEMDLVLQAPRGLLLIAYDGTQSDGVIKMASQTGIEFAPRSSAVSAPGNYAYFDNLDETVDSGAAVSLHTSANHLYLQYGKTTQAIVLPTVANASVANLVDGILIYDTGTNKLMVYANGGWETVTSS